MDIRIIFCAGLLLAGVSRCGSALPEGSSRTVEEQATVSSRETESTVSTEKTAKSGPTDASEESVGSMKSGAALSAQGERAGVELPAPIKGRAEVILHRLGYTVSYNPDWRIPNWVAWHLTAAHLDGHAQRASKTFREDEDVPTPRADTYDYMRSGYDRGHMCPAGDNHWSEEAMEQSFLLSNVCPQNHNLNTGDWNEMEQQCRRWAREYGDIYIVCGPILLRSSRRKTIGQHKVVVPDAFFKVVLCLQGTPKAIGFIYRNQAGNRPKGDYVNSVDEVERITGIDFFPALPDKVERQVEREVGFAL